MPASPLEIRGVNRTDAARRRVLADGLEHLVRRQREALEGGGVREFVELSVDFHRGFVEAGGTPMSPPNPAPTINRPDRPAPSAATTFMVVSEVPCIAGRRAAGFAFVSIAEPAIRLNDHPSPSRNIPPITMAVDP